MRGGAKSISNRDKMKIEKMFRPKKTGGESGKVISDADVKKVAAMLEKPKKAKTDRQIMQFKDGGGVCRGGRSAERGTSFRGVR
tara:strand:+ start:16 stop:267 length:252 start_codon:yes stop_codon:yes gene_type:complete